MLLLSPLEKRHGISFKQPFPCKRMLCVPSSSGEEVVNEFSLFAIISHWKKEVSVHMKKVEFPLTKQSLCQVWFKCLSCGCGIEKKTKMWKIYDSDDDDGQQTR